MQELRRADRIYLPNVQNRGGLTRYGVPRRKRYLSEHNGTIPGSIWTDISPVQPGSKERTGSPTQKPLALMERIVNASSDEGNVVLDPSFCGCATTHMASHNLKRKSVGIDISRKAVELVKMRFKDTQLPMFSDMTSRTDIPKRTDADDTPNHRT